MTTIRTFFPQISALFPIFEEGQGRPPPITPSSYAPALRISKNLSAEYLFNEQKKYEYLKIWVFEQQNAEAAIRDVLNKKTFLKISQNSRESTCARVSFLVLSDKRDSGQMLSCEFCEFFKNTFFTEHRRATTFENEVSFFSNTRFFYK